MYYRLFDQQTGCYLATGYNAEGFKDLAEQYASYKSIDAEDEEEFRQHFASLTEEDQRNYISSDEFEIEESEKQFEEDTSW